MLNKNETLDLDCVDCGKRLNVFFYTDNSILSEAMQEIIRKTEE